VKQLLQHGADVNLPGGKHGYALQAAVCSHHDDDHTPVIKALLDAGADVNAQGGRYGTALQAAAYHNLQHVEILIEHGADVNARGGRFGSPLLAAKAKGLKRVVKLLMEKGAIDDDASVSIPKDEYVKKPSIHMHLG
jgi:ankyrin repeat protein